MKPVLMQVGKSYSIISRRRLGASVSSLALKYYVGTFEGVITLRNRTRYLFSKFGEIQMPNGQIEWDDRTVVRIELDDSDVLTELGL